MENMIPPQHLQLLRDTCAQLISRTDADMDRRGVTVYDITHKNKRYFIDGAYAQMPCLADFIFSPYMAEICRATIGPNAFLFKNQFVVKCAEVGMNFSWHQDSGYIPEPHKPYISCWCALDDANRSNGTIYILPASRAGGSGLRPHQRLADTNDLVGYDGDDPGDPIEMAAGGIAIFSSRTLHRSGANTTGGIRRIYLAQYSPHAMPAKAGTTRQAISFLHNGKICR